MEPITFLIYLSIVMVSIIGVQLIFVLVRLYKILKTASDAAQIVDKIIRILDVIHTLPIEKISSWTRWFKKDSSKK